jgi:DNA-binding winged helix-turn-helix (wHTH) protein/TolB-like protein
MMALAAESVADFGFDRYSIDRSDERLIGPHGPIKLGNKAFQVLVKLLEQQGRLVTKDALMSTVWDGTIVSEFSLTSAIKELRRALGDDAREPRYIQSVYGRGYRFLGEIETIDPAERPAAPVRAEVPGVEWASTATLPAVSNDAVLPLGIGRSIGTESQDRASLSHGLRRLLGNLVPLAIVVSSALALAPNQPGQLGSVVNAAPQAATVQASGPVTMAVLPFADLSEPEKSGHSLRGIEEQVISVVGNEPGIRVTGRSVSSLFGSDADFQGARRQVGLTHLLEGSLQVDGETIRVNIRMLRANDATLIWSDRFELPAAEARVEELVGNAVAARVRARMRDAARATDRA